MSEPNWWMFSRSPCVPSPLAHDLVEHVHVAVKSQQGARSGCALALQRGPHAPRARGISKGRSPKVLVQEFSKSSCLPLDWAGSPQLARQLSQLGQA